MEYAINPRVNPHVGKTSETAALTTLLQPVICAHAHPIDAIMESFRGWPAQAGLIRRADSATTGTGTRRLSWRRRE